MDTPEFPDALIAKFPGLSIEKAPPDLPDALFEAGRSYHEALKKLDFDPEGLFWAYDVKDEKFRLWLVWSGLDRYGPLSISKLLFRAYRAAILPREIDPFIIYVVSPDHDIGKGSHKLYDSRNDAESLNAGVSASFILRDNPVDRKALHIMTSNWVYRLTNRRYSAKKINQNWRKFNEHINALAA